MIEIILNSIKEMVSWTKRHKELCEHAKETIVNEGGTIDKITMIGFLLHSPFPPINIRPVYLKIRCRYSNDLGYWYICGSEKNTYWAWKSLNGFKEPPSKRSYEVKVDNNILAFPRWASILFYLIFVILLFGGITAYSILT